MTHLKILFLLVLVGLTFILSGTSASSEKRSGTPKVSQSAQEQAIDSKNQEVAIQKTDDTAKTSQPEAPFETNDNRTQSKNWKDWYAAFGPPTWSQWVLAFFGVIAAIVGLRTLSSISRQVKANEEAAKAAKESADIAVAAQRPWVGIDHVITESLEANKPFIIKATLRNSGRSPALQWRAFFEPEATILQTKDFKIKSIEDPYGSYSSGVLMPNATFTIDISVPAEWLTDKQVSRIKSKADTIYIFGQTDYVDSSGNRHKTLISMFYDVYISRFGYCTEGNYAD